MILGSLVKLTTSCSSYGYWSAWSFMGLEGSCKLSELCMPELQDKKGLPLKAPQLQTSQNPSLEDGIHLENLLGIIKTTAPLR